jgi:paraquat-inducible protein A
VEATACPDCDLVQALPDLPPGGKARCARCGRILATRVADPIDRPLALTVAAAIIFAVANTSPLMGLSAVGRQASTTIAGGVREMWATGQEITAVVVAFCALVAPGGYIAFMLTVLLAARRPPAPPWVGDMLRAAHAMRAWSMSEVMLLGILVALVKIAQLATVEPGIGLYAMGALVLLLAATMESVDPHELWSRVAWTARDAAPASEPPGSTREADGR